MEWWQQLGYSSEEEAIARGESEEVFNKTRKKEVPTLSDIQQETEYIKKFIEDRDDEPVDEVEETGGTEDTPTKYIIVQGPDGRYIKQADPNGTYTDATVQAEIDRLNKQRDANLLNEKLKSGSGDSGTGDGVYTPKTTPVEYTPVATTGLTTREEAKLRFPYLDERLIDVYVKGFIETGDRNLALLQMRSDPLMEVVYPGIRKADGTLRMTEQEYYVAREFMQLELRNYNLNPQVFEADIVEAISGDVSPDEFRERLATGYQNIVQNIPQVKEVYLREFNLDLNEESIFGMFISPRLSTSVLENQIRQSQIIAEAETSLGARALTVEVARGLQQQGLTQEQARRGFQAAGTILPGLSAGAERFGRGPISATEYVQATELGRQDIAQNIRRVQSQLESASSAQAGAKQLRTGEVTGLIEG